MMFTPPSSPLVHSDILHFIWQQTLVTMNQFADSKTVETSTWESSSMKTLVSIKNSSMTRYLVWPMLIILFVNVLFEGLVDMLFVPMPAKECTMLPPIFVAATPDVALQICNDL